MPAQPTNLSAWLDTIPRPPHTPDEAHAADLEDDERLIAWTRSLDAAQPVLALSSDPATDSLVQYPLAALSDLIDSIGRWVADVTSDPQR